MSMNSSTKKTLTIIGIAGAIVIAALLIYAILVTPQKQPYRDALTQYKNVYNSNVQLTVRGSSLGASTATDEQFAKNIAAAKDAIRALSVENDALGKAEVLKTGEGKTLYDAFNAKLARYMQYNKDMLESVEIVRPIVFECSKVLGDVSADPSGVDVVRSCAQKFANLGAIKDADYRAYVQISQQRYADLANSLEQSATLADPEGTDADRAEELNREVERIITDMTADGTALSKDLSTHKRAVDITSVAMKLDNYLQKQSNIF